MSLTSLFSVARSALLAQERAVSVIGHNIANAETPGYTRQRLMLAAATPESIAPLGQIGRGVSMIGIARARSGFLDDSFRRESGLQSRYSTLHQTLSEVSGILAEPSDSGIKASLDALIGSFQSLASNPTDGAARAVVVASAVSFTDKLRSTDSRLQGVAEDIKSQLQDSVREANSAITEISSLNTSIRAAGGQAPDLLDRRDQLLDKLSGLVGVRVIPREFGTVDVLVGSMQVVSSGGAAQPVSVGGTGPYTLQLGNPPLPASDVQGQVRGLVDAFNAIGTRGTPTARATGLRGRLDDFAAGLVTAANEIHSGYSPGTKPLQPTITPAPSPLQTVGSFFDPNGITAGTIRLDASILADANNISAGYSTAAGDNSIALRLGDLSSLVVPVPGGSPATTTSPATTAGPPSGVGEFYIGVIASLGVATRDAGDRSVAQKTVADNLASQRQAVSGVSIDEELASLIEHQNAYTAAARLVQIADDMMKVLVNLGR